MTGGAHFGVYVLSTPKTPIFLNAAKKKEVKTHISRLSLKKLY
jgi:hypothetical protein